MTAFLGTAILVAAFFGLGCSVLQAVTAAWHSTGLTWTDRPHRRGSNQRYEMRWMGGRLFCRRAGASRFMEVDEC